ncbi:hypothetical protein NHB13_10560 [Delftia tsuruhatensis]|uniref:hypothetical protein n=1 Tax=Delftia tsuruhatensis TaxID=180282 RepID=UPI0020904C72|nr:hypothetical protein [Delftia tsuruhatensis]MCO5337040.1 hypothetical protein [Delftia tsuruhatensis]
MTTFTQSSCAELTFQQWESAVMELLRPQPKGTALKLGQHGAILLVLDELAYLESGDSIRDAGSCEASAWEGKNLVSGMQALAERTLFQRCSPQEVEADELEILQFFLQPLPHRKVSYDDFARYTRMLLLKHPAGTALQVPNHLDYLLVGGLLSCIDSLSSIDGICLRDAGNWSSMEADLEALRSPKFFQRFCAEELEAYLQDGHGVTDLAPAATANTSHMSCLEYECAVMELLVDQPKGTGLKDDRGAIFLINGELMHVAEGKELDDATDCDPEAWGDTDPAPDLEALARAELVQVFSTADVIAFERTRSS